MQLYVISFSVTLTQRLLKATSIVLLYKLEFDLV